MTNIELALNTLAEASVTEISKQRRPKGFQQNVKVARSGGSVAKAARTQLEKQLGHSVVSPINAAQVLAAKKNRADRGRKRQRLTDAVVSKLEIAAIMSNRDRRVPVFCSNSLFLIQNSYLCK